MATARTLVRELNGRWHGLALWGFMAIVVAHLAEHAVQSVQIFVLGWARPDAGGVLGLWFPWLVESESLHYLYAIVTLAGIILLLPGFVGRARAWWIAALVTQFWHHFEHALLLFQRVTGSPFFGEAVPTSLVQLVVPRVELHLFYNAVVFLPMLVAFWYHYYPPRREATEAPCRCARRRSDERPRLVERTEAA